MEDLTAIFNKGNQLLAQGRFEQALAVFEKTLLIKPDHVGAMVGRGNAFGCLARFEEALDSFESALAIQPNNALVLKSKGDVLTYLKRREEAVESYSMALIIQPDFADAACNQALAHFYLGQDDKALFCFEQALAINRDYPFIYGMWLHTKMKLCDWSGLNKAFANLVAGVAERRRISPPFVSLATPLSAPLQRRCSETMIEAKFPAKNNGPVIERSNPHDRIRLGYFSADFREQVVAHLTAGLFEAHDRRRFTLIAFSFGTHSEVPIRTRIKAAFDKFIDTGDMSDPEIARMARELEIDIAIDLTGFTDNGRTGIFAERAAPLQVNFLGYPGTMGADYYDYIIADPILIPVEHYDYYSEKVVRLPNTYMVNDSKRTVPDNRFTRQDVGLPEEGFVFCSFNPSFKITPLDFDIWMRLLTMVEDSVLWLGATNLKAKRNLLIEARARGVSPDRLIFKEHSDLLIDHLSQIKLADLFLDTTNFNAHTNANDALWAGVPILTRLGETFASRVAASLLGAVGLPELVAESTEAYESLALELATNSEKLADIRRRLEKNRSTHPLFDTVLFTRNIEEAFTSMWERHQQRLSPKHINISS